MMNISSKHDMINSSLHYASSMSLSSSDYKRNLYAMSGYALAIRHDKLDYSMTKGGLRLWIVVLVFILLIAGLVTIFQNKALADLELESGEQLVDDGEMDETMLLEKELMDKRIEEYRAKKKRREAEQLATARDDEEEENEDHEERRYVGHHEHEESDEEQKRESYEKSEPEPELKPKVVAKPPPPVVKKRTKEASKEEELRLKRLSELAEAKHRTQEEEEEKKEEAEKIQEVVVEDEIKEEQVVEDSFWKKLWKKKDELLGEKEEEIPPVKHAKHKERPPKKGKPVKHEEEEEEETVEAPEKSVKPEEEIVEAPEKSAKHEEEIIEAPKKSAKREEVVEEAPPKIKEPKILKPVKVFRTKGKAKDELPGQQEITKEPGELEIEDETESEVEKKPVKPVEVDSQKVSKKPSKPAIAVKTFRTKGRTPEEETSIRRALIEESQKDEEEDEGHEEEEPFREETCEKGAKCHDEEAVSKKPKKPHIAIKVTHKKGKPPGESRVASERHVTDDEEQDESVAKHEKPRKPIIPVQVFRTKGGTAKKPSVAEQQEQSWELDDQDTVAEKLAKRRQPSAPSYRKHTVTNREDNKIRTKLDQADRLLEEREPDEALELFDQILKTYPSSPRAQYGRARALDLMAELKQSNSLLEESIRNYLLILELANVPEELYVLAANRYIDRAKFRGWVKKALDVQRKLVDKFPDDMKILNDFGVMFLIMGRSDDAKKVFETVLAREPENGFALTHYGFILKTADNKLEDSVEYLHRGINSGEEGTQDGRFFFQLGDALQRLNRSEEAYEIYEKGAQNGIFLSKLQRSLYNVESLTARPWWTPEQTTYVNQLKRIESEWRTVKDEGVALLDQKNIIFKKEDEKLTKEGDWRQFTLYTRGKKNDENCARAPKTCALVEKFSEAVGCTRGQIKFSVMEGGTRIWPHCGPTNCRLRGHLGLIVPPDPRIRVGNETRAWKRGKFIIFDDSFEHEVWYEGSGFRLVLIVDFWHPELTAQQRASLTPI